jgi:hypothetical protein
MAIAWGVLILSVSAGRAATIRFDAVNGAAAGGFYVAPYTVSLDGSSIEVMCLDVDRHVTFGNVWTVNVHSVDDPGLDFALSNNSSEKYRAAAVLWTWLQDGIVSKAAASFAVWNLFRPDFALTSGSEAAVSQLAATNFVEQHTGLSYTGVSFLTPTTHGVHNNQYQEFITGRVVMTPEPGSLFLGGAACS